MLQGTAGKGRPSTVGPLERPLMVSYPGSPGVHSGPLYTRSGRPWQMMDARLWRFSSRKWRLDLGASMARCDAR